MTSIQYEYEHSYSTRCDAHGAAPRPRLQTNRTSMHLIHISLPRRLCHPSSKPLPRNPKRDETSPNTKYCIKNCSSTNSPLASTLGFASPRFTSRSHSHSHSSRFRRCLTSSGRLRVGKGKGDCTCFQTGRGSGFVGRWLVFASED